MRALDYQSINLSSIGDQQQDRLIAFSSFQGTYAINGDGIERIGAKPVERVRAKRNHPTLFDYFVQFVLIRVCFKLGASSTFASKPETYGLTTEYDDAK